MRASRARHMPGTERTDEKKNDFYNSSRRNLFGFGRAPARVYNARFLFYVCNAFAPSAPRRASFDLRTERGSARARGFPVFGGLSAASEGRD